MKRKNNMWSDDDNTIFLKTFFFKNGFLFFAMAIFSLNTYSQQELKEIQKEQKESNEYLSEATAQINEGNFVPAEAEYRKAIALNPKDDTGKYNLGNAYYGKKRNAEAMYRYKQAASVATSKSEKHKAFHNLGNTYMNEKKYSEAVEAYKNALRNNPNDDETRYNLALAKDMLEKNPPPPDDQNKDKDKKDQDKKDNQDQQDKKDQGDKGDQKDQKDKGDQKDENKEGDQNKDKGKPDEPKDEKEGDKPQQQQPVPGQLSPQQVKSLLEAMNNEEKKVQDKVNAEKQKGAKVQSSKDW